MDIEKIIEKMSVDEKIAFCVGKNEWYTKPYEQYGIRSIMVSDGPHGLRCQKDVNNYKSINESLPATCFPTAVASGSSWNKDLIYEEGKAIGEEALEYGVSVVLGPGANIKRNPLGGRNFEYISEDPYLSGKMAASLIKGIQSCGVGTSLKHYAANNQEYKRMNGNSIIDERALREIYLKSFEIAVKEGKPYTVMCCYNKVNGIHGSDNKFLMNDVLRDEWGFDGLVMTDWGAMTDRIEAFKAGCDLSMPGGHSFMHEAVKKAIEEGRLSEEDLDRSVRRMLKLIERTGSNKEKEYDRQAHHLLAQTVEEDSAVLLKNDGILPLDLNDICLVGHMAEEIRYQGSGSSHINPTRLENLTDLLDVPYMEAVDRNGKLIVDEEKLAQFAKGHKKVVVVAGLVDSYESEGFDRKDMKLPEGHLRMIDICSRSNDNVVVVLISGSAVECDFADRIKGLLYVGLPGQAGAQAIVNLLSGKANPSGRLSETWPFKYEDVISRNTFGKTNPEYKESIYVGYRYYTSAAVKARYPFGYGLSYSRFSYGDLKVDKGRLTCTITNTSDVKGKEVVELYVEPLDRSYMPLRQLKDFCKIELEPHESKEVSFAIRDDFFEVYADGFRKRGGEYYLELGRNAEDIIVREKIAIEGEQIGWNLKGSFYEDPENAIKDSDWHAVLGYAPPEDAEPRKGQYTMDSTPLEMSKDSLFMKIFVKIIGSVVRKSFPKDMDESDPGYQMMYTCAVDCPMRTIQMNAAESMTDNRVAGMLEMANGHFFKGLAKVIRG